MLASSLLAHSEGEASQSASWLSQLLHQPTWVGLILVAVVLTAIYFLAAKVFRLNFVGRLLTMVGAAILIGVLYLPHNPTVTAIVLSTGFIFTFLLTFMLLGRLPK